MRQKSPPPPPGPKEVVGGFDLNGLSYRMVRRLDDPGSVWVEGPGPAFDQRYPLKVLSHVDPSDPTRLAVWVEITGLVCFPGRFGVDVSHLGRR
jgi:hypothetical protein